MNCSLCVTFQQTSYQSKTWIVICVQLVNEPHNGATRRLQSISYSGVRFVDKLHTDYNSCLTPVLGSLTSYTQITIHVLLRFVNEPHTRVRHVL
jgi:aryl-phospho-beta-D-glucosidase BglC (GH1 family)